MMSQAELAGIWASGQSMKKNGAESEIRFSPAHKSYCDKKTN
jgi:hypothetical protein